MYFWDLYFLNSNYFELLCNVNVLCFALFIYVKSWSGIFNNRADDIYILFLRNIFNGYYLNSHINDIKVSIKQSF